MKWVLEGGEECPLGEEGKRSSVETERHTDTVHAGRLDGGGMEGKEPHVA